MQSSKILLKVSEYAAATSQRLLLFFSRILPVSTYNGRVSAISSAIYSSTTLTVSVCYERFTSPSHFSIGLFACAGGGATYCGIAPGNYGKLSPSYKVKSGVLLPLGRSLTLLLGGFYRGAFGDNEYESVYDNAVSLSGKVSVPVASEKWGASGTVSRFELTDLGLELGLRFNLRLDST